MTTYNCPIVEVEDGELAIEFSDELMKEFDFSQGDVLEFTNFDNGFVVRKVRSRDE